MSSLSLSLSLSLSRVASKRQRELEMVKFFTKKKSTCQEVLNGLHAEDEFREKGIIFGKKARSR